VGVRLRARSGARQARGRLRGLEGRRECCAAPRRGSPPAAVRVASQPSAERSPTGTGAAQNRAGEPPPGAASALPPGVGSSPAALVLAGLRRPSLGFSGSGPGETRLV